MGDSNLRFLNSAEAKLRAAAATAFIAFVACTQAASSDRFKTQVTTEKVPSQVIYEFSRQVGPGRVVKGRAGQDGLVTRTYLIKVHNGKATLKKLVNTETRKPVDTIMLMGRAGFSPSRSSFKRGSV